MRSSANDRIYIFLMLTLCFGFPTLTIVTSYLAILITVYRSNRTLASISSSFVSHASKDLRLAKMAAVVCASFLLAWMPYATVSLISAFLLKDDQRTESSLQTVVQEAIGMSTHPPAPLKILDVPSLLNWTASEYYRQFYYNPEEKVDNAIDINPSLSETMFRPTPSPHSISSLPPVVTLIPVIFAKSHCMLNPIIYQIMNREFRDEVYLMVFGREKAKRRRPQSRMEGLSERSMSISYCQNWRRRSSPIPLPVERKNRNMKCRVSGGQGSNVSRNGDAPAGTNAIDFVSLDTRVNMERHCSVDGQKTRGDFKDLESSTLSQTDG